MKHAENGPFAMVFLFCFFIGKHDIVPKMFLSGVCFIDHLKLLRRNLMSTGQTVLALSLRVCVEIAYFFWGGLNSRI